SNAEARMVFRERFVTLAALFAPVASDEFYLSKIAVCPRARGHLLGRVLLDHYIEKGRRMGFRRFRLEVSHTNLGAIRLYESAGFRTVERRRSERHDLTYLSMALAS